MQEMFPQEHAPFGPFNIVASDGKRDAAQCHAKRPSCETDKCYNKCSRFGPRVS